MSLLPHPVLPHSEGEIVLDSADPAAPPAIHMNYYDDPHDHEGDGGGDAPGDGHRSHWPGNRKPGPVNDPAVPGREAWLSERGEPPSDALLEDFALHFSLTVYHPTLDLPDRRCRRSAAAGIGRRPVCAWRTPASCRTVMRGNTNAPSIMIGEKAAEMIARDHNVKLKQFVGAP